MKSLTEYIKEGYEGQYYNGVAVGPFKTKTVVNFERELSYFSDNIDGWIETYFDCIEFDKINSELGQQRFLWYLKEFLDHFAISSIKHNVINDISFRKKDILIIKEYIENKLNIKLDNWQDKLKKEYYDKSDEPSDKKELFNYFLDNTLTKNEKQYKKYIGKLVKFNIKNYKGGNTGPYAYRRLFRDNPDIFKENMKLYTYFLWPERGYFNCIFITDDKFNVIFDWSDAIHVESISYEDIENLEICNNSEYKKFKDAFTSKVLNDHLSTRITLYDYIVPSIIFNDCPIKLPDDIEFVFSSKYKK